MKKEEKNKKEVLHYIFIFIKLERWSRKGKKYQVPLKLGERRKKEEEYFFLRLK